jgi:hypothetical protein
MTLPPTMVATTSIARISSGVDVAISPLRIVTSPIVPGQVTAPGLVTDGPSGLDGHGA